MKALVILQEQYKMLSKDIDEAIKELEAIKKNIDTSIEEIEYALAKPKYASVYLNNDLRFLNEKQYNMQSIIMKKN